MRFVYLPLLMLVIVCVSAFSFLSSTQLGSQGLAPESVVHLISKIRASKLRKFDDSLIHFACFLSQVTMMWHGPCQKESAVLDKNSADRSMVGPSVQEVDRDSDVWITTVLPAVVIAVILVLAACIACILYKVG